MQRGRPGGGAEGVNLAVEIAEERWAGLSGMQAHCPEVLGRKHYNADSQPSFKQNSRADLHSSVWLLETPPVCLLPCDTLTRGVLQTGEE